MRYFAHYGLSDFIVALGYRGDLVRHWAAAFEHCADGASCSWDTRFIDTGESTATGGRVRRLAPHLGEDPFVLSWVDGLSTVAIPELLAFHALHGRLVTAVAVRPPPRFGHFELDGDDVVCFEEKPRGREGWISGGLFVIEPGVLDYLDDDLTDWDRQTMPRLAADRQLVAFRHEGYWQCMDTEDDREQLELAWQAGAPWAVWQ